ncbi:MAG: N-acetyltransferase family protein [Clostridia bacterium]|nr:N-acetyltransferase family protein [Clostridia bacterium]
MDYKLEKMLSTDWKDVERIYSDGIQTGKATFQMQVPDWEEWNAVHLQGCRYVARLGEQIIGWIACSPTSSRACYAGVVEVSVYVDPQYKRMGVGTELLKKAIACSEEQGIWTLYCSIIKENVESINLHKKCGFREIGYRERIAKMQDGLWHDTILLERRSKIAGSL